MLKGKTFHFDHYSITSLRFEDIYKIKNWRNQQIAFLRQKHPITDEQQFKYFENYVKPTFSDPEPTQILVSYLKEGTCIGYGGLTNLKWEDRRAEVSFLLDSERVQDNLNYKKEFTIFLNLLKQMAFDFLGLHRLFTETFDLRPTHIETLEGAGFTFEGRMKDHIFCEGRFVDSLIHGCLKK